jgi:hypothetical protein
MEDIQVLEQKDRVVIQSYFKLRHNHNNYTFIDYIYEDTNEPVECGEFSSVFDNNGSLIENEQLRDSFGEFCDIVRTGRNTSKFDK